ncbi:MAG: hypothetical protein LBL75_03015 [Rickettsiales bacterium]|jgi:hypothetical protein|nr:hypothetical protein [Rickettsiales bacterium]
MANVLTKKNYVPLPWGLEHKILACDKSLKTHKKQYRLICPYYLRYSQFVSSNVRGVAQRLCPASQQTPDKQFTCPKPNRDECWERFISEFTQNKK